MKYRILAALRDSNAVYLSGEELSRQLKVSRTAVWKCIKELRQEGYEIASLTNRGYRLVSEPDIMNAHELGKNLQSNVIGNRIIYFEELDSTNARAKEIAADSPDGTVVAAGKQTAGRGRLGRKWESPESTGIYMSVIIKPDIPPEDVQLITLAASVAVVAALQEAAGIAAGIKWPNDIVLDGRKACGILTEMSTEMERVNYVVLGIGINFSQKPADFPEELRNKAVSVSGFLAETNPSAVLCSKADLARSVIEKMDVFYGMLLYGQKREIISMWKRMSATLGREVSIIGREASFTGKAVDITEDGRLVIQCSDGTRREVLSGEVSVRGLLGYV